MRRRTSLGRPEKHGKPYTEEEFDLILRLPPAKGNIHLLAESLRRSEDAIQMIYLIAYGRLQRAGKPSQAIVRKVQEAKRRAGFVKLD